MKTIPVTFTVPVTTADGKFHEGGSTAKLPAHEARELVYWGRARREDKVAESQAKPVKKASRSRTKSADTETADSSTADDGDTTEGNTP